MIVVVTAEAEADIEAIGDYIARDNPSRAVSFVQEVVERCFRLADTPQGFPLVPRYEASGIRRRAYGWLRSRSKSCTCCMARGISRPFSSRQIDQGSLQREGQAIGAGRRRS